MRTPPALHAVWTIILLGLPASSPASPTARCDPEQTAKITASDGAKLDNFGVGVSVSGDVALIGAYADDDRGDESGSAYVFLRDGTQWVQTQKLTAFDGAPGDFFGANVAVRGDVALIGASHDTDNGWRSGSAYVFRHDGKKWVEEAKLTPADADDGDLFGTAVAITGDVAVVGAVYDDDHGYASGSAYVFRRDDAGWVQEAKLTAADGAEDDNFGIDLSISGSTIVIGARFDDTYGSVYVFRHVDGQWVEEAKLTAADPGRDHFGHVVSIDGDVVIVGAHQGAAAYVFRRAGQAWAQEQKLTTSAVGGSRNLFGWSVAVKGDVTIVGAMYDGDRGYHAGAAYLFRRVGATWVAEEKITAADGAVRDRFGWWVALGGDLALISARYDDERMGSVYAFDLDCPVACPADLDGSGDVGFADLLAVLDAWGNEGGPEDLDGSGTVDFGDLLIVLDSWGPCG